MKIAFVIAALAAAGFVYVYWLRPYLKDLPQFSEVWRDEETAWAAICAWLDGRKTILIGIWGEVIAFAPDVLNIVAGADLKVALNLPDNWAALVNIVVPVLMMVFRVKAKPQV